MTINAFFAEIERVTAAWRDAHGLPVLDEQGAIDWKQRAETAESKLPPELAEKIREIADKQHHYISAIDAINEAYPLIAAHVAETQRDHLLGVAARVADYMTKEVAGGENVGKAIRALKGDHDERK